MKKTWSPIKEVLFTYLAVSKIWYWFAVAVGVEGNNWAEMGRILLDRLLGRDLTIIVCVIIFFYMEKRIRLKKSKYSTIVENIIFYTAGYIIFALAISINIVLLSIFTSSTIGSIPELVVYATAGYILTFAVLYIKERLKGEEAPLASETHRKHLSMLKTLRDEGYLTQEEFNRKKGILA